MIEADRMAQAEAEIASLRASAADLKTLNGELAGMNRRIVIGRWVTATVASVATIAGMLTHQWLHGGACH